MKEKKQSVFPPVYLADEQGLLAVGGSLDPSILKGAYQNGIFPWPISEDLPIAWFAPNPRGILKTSNFHLPKSFQKFLKRHPYQISYNQDFFEVIRQCGLAKRPGQRGTWITPELLHGYDQLFKNEQAYSIEIKNSQGQLVGGLYGVCFGNYISGESMFYKESNCSKLALYCCIENLKQAQISFLDIQMVTPTLEQMGGENIERLRFMEMIQSIDFDAFRRKQIFTLDFS